MLYKTDKFRVSVVTFLKFKAPTYVGRKRTDKYRTPCNRLSLLRKFYAHRAQLGEFNGTLAEQSHKLPGVRATHSFTGLLVAMQLIQAD